jgi:tRNA (cytidine/uridine-2'-O-)-methyltransferase
MLHVVLVEPEIPPNTGNIARLCAATRSRLHLIGRLGFRLDDKAVRRAGLDYWPHVDWVYHETWQKYLGHIGSRTQWLIENPAPRSYTNARFEDECCLVFGKESIGLPYPLREQYAEQMLEIPMLGEAVRSLNLATAAGIVLYEALRQIQGW